MDKAGNSNVARIDFVVNTSLIGGPGWFDDAVVFGLVVVVVVAVVVLIRKLKK